MIKVIQNINTTKCPNCHCKIEYADSDVERLTSIDFGFNCPNCGCDVITETKEEGLYPEAFYSFAKGVDISDATINDHIQHGKQYLMENEDEFYYYWASGNTFIILIKSDEENIIEVTVAKNYSSTEIFY